MTAVAFYVSKGRPYARLPYCPHRGWISHELLAIEVFIAPSARDRYSPGLPGHQPRLRGGFCVFRVLSVSAKTPDFVPARDRSLVASRCAGAIYKGGDGI